MKRQNLLLKDVAALLKLKPYQITYKISVGLLPEPKIRISNKRIFQADDVERIAAHFGVDLKTTKGTRGIK